MAVTASFLFVALQLSSSSACACSDQDCSSTSTSAPLGALSSGGVPDQGTTATVVVVTGPLVTCANIGSSRAVLDMGASRIELTKDHRLGCNEDEDDRLALGDLSDAKVPIVLAASFSGCPCCVGWQLRSPSAWCGLCHGDMARPFRNRIPHFSMACLALQHLTAKTVLTLNRKPANPPPPRSARAGRAPQLQPLRPRLPQRRRVRPPPPLAGRSLLLTLLLPLCFQPSWQCSLQCSMQSSFQ